MQKLIETLKSFGIEVPEEKQAEVKKALSEHYKNASEHNKAISKLETDRDTWKQKAEAAEETLKGFDGVDVEKLNKDIADWKERATKAEKDAADQILKRDQRDYLKGEFDKLGITSDRTRKSLMADIMGEDGLKWKDGAYMGLSDYLKQENEKDHFYQTEEEKAEAEAKEKAAGSAPKFTDKSDGKPAGGDNKPTFNFGFTPIREVKKGD